MNLIFRLALTSCLSLPLVCQDPTPPKPSPAPVQDPVPAPTEKKPAEQPKVLQLGERINGDITLSDIDGRTQRAHDLMGSITVVNFYSIQCPIQANWDGRLAQIQKDFAEQGVNFLHINSNVTEIGETAPKVEGDARPYDNVRQHLAKKELPFRVLVDHGNKVADMFDAKTTPHIYVFGKDGRLVYKGLVDDDQHDKKQDTRNNYLSDVLGKLVKGEKVEPTANKEVGCTIKRISAGAPRGQRGQGGQGGRSGRGGD